MIAQGASLNPTTVNVLLVLQILILNCFSFYLNTYVPLSNYNMTIYTLIVNSRNKN